MPKASDVGVIVGRFQVHQLHDAHRQLIQSVYDTHRQTVIVLGLSASRVTTRNPLDFEARKQMMLDAFPKATVLYINDEPDDTTWSKRLDKLILDTKSITQTATLYGGRDSFISHYNGIFPTEVLEPEVYASGTEMRKSISKAVKGTPDFRAGVIWAAANGYPRTFPTVDVAIYRDLADVKDTREWLLVRKPNEKLWRFVGGFVDPSDKSLEMAARREVQEETGVTINDPKYVASLRVDDWRYREEEDKILTTLFAASYLAGPVAPADDVADAQWFNLVGAGVGTFMPVHLPLFEALKNGGLV